MGINPRPTVAEWIQQKNEQKKTAIQEALISWDRGKQTREAAILLQQTITSHRAMKHAAWGAKKDINSKLKALKNSSPPAGKQWQPSYKQRKEMVAMSKRTKATGKLKTPAAYLKQQRMAAAKTESKPRSKQSKHTLTTCKES